MTTSTSAPTNIAFSGSIPQIYERYLVPLIFSPYAADMAARVAQHKPKRVLELACGTGVVTRQMVDALPADTEIVATDLNPAMLAEATRIGTSRAVKWEQADALQLPFPDNSFDVVACQYGVMFFPDKAKAFAEAKRVLRPGGLLVFNVWDRVDQNDFIAVTVGVLTELFPDNPPSFITQIPYGYYDFNTIAGDLANGGFDQRPDFETLAFSSNAESAHIPALAYCQGTPLRTEIEARGASLEEVTTLVEAAIAKKFGAHNLEGQIQAHVVSVIR